MPLICFFKQKLNLKLSRHNAKRYFRQRKHKGQQKFITDADERRKLMLSAYIVSLGTLIARVVGFIRETVVAPLFGTEWLSIASVQL
jgi:hypothetical protein